MEYSTLLTDEMQQTLQKVGYTTPTPIQEQSLESLLGGSDLIGIAQTGTGKTAAFAIPIIERVFSDNKKTQALVLCPTRELAIQTTEVFRSLSAHKKLRTVSIYGGQAPAVQIRALRAGAQIVVGTPGRVKDMIARNVLKLKNVRFAVLDEADEMLEFGFLPDMRHILSLINGEHQTMMFSATMSREISRVAAEFLCEPVRVEAGERNQPAKTVAQTCIKLDECAKPAIVQKLLSENTDGLTLIFCNTRRRVKRLTMTLNGDGISTACIHGDLSQNQRDAIMRGVRNGNTSVLVATDVAARGIDVEHIDLVINYDVPEKPEYYVHRIGRTGRAGNNGTAYTLVSRADSSGMADIKRRYNLKLSQQSFSLPKVAAPC